MRNLILGTAGHIDHGKTSLVRALTGVDTDRLAEEKARGITIDLGFAELTDAQVRFGIVDVPGHEGFVRNMVAGATGMDVVLLVVSAEEGVMPQTREHLAIVELLGVRSLVVALTKSDLVDPDWLELAREDVRDLLADGLFAGSPIVATSAESGDGLEELRTALVEVTGEDGVVRSDDLMFLPVDRVFSVRGTGTVVTGTLWTGSVAVGARVRILPGGVEARVRGVQRHGQDADEAEAGSRAALALVGDGVEKEALHRGQAVVSLRGWEPSAMLTVRLRVLPGTGWEMEQGQRVRLHHGTAEVMARCVLLAGDRLGEGEEGWAQLRLEEPLAARVRQRFVLRSYSPMVTFAGGTVVESHPPKRRRSSDPPVDLLQAVLEGQDDECVAAAVALARTSGAPERLLPVFTGLTPARCEAALRVLAQRGAVLTDGSWVAPDVAEGLQVELMEAVDRVHRDEPFREGATVESLRAMAPAGSPRGLADTILGSLADSGTVEITGGLVARSGFSPTLTEAQEALREEVRRRYREAGLQPPTVVDLPAELRADPAFGHILRRLEQAGELVALDAELYCWRETLATAAARTVEALAGREDLGPADFKEVLPVSRRYLLPILRYFDGAGVTRNNGDVRAVLG
jgi:selenocysteine-specific elongation factor